MILLNDFIKTHIIKITKGDIIPNYYKYYDIDKIKFIKDIYYNNIDLLVTKYKRIRIDSKFSDSYNIYRVNRFSYESSYDSNEYKSEDEEIEDDNNIWENEHFYDYFK